MLGTLIYVCGCFDVYGCQVKYQPIQMYCNAIEFIAISTKTFNYFTHKWFWMGQSCAEVISDDHKFYFIHNIIQVSQCFSTSHLCGGQSLVGNQISLVRAVGLWLDVCTLHMPVLRRWWVVWCAVINLWTANIQSWDNVQALVAPSVHIRVHHRPSYSGVDHPFEYLTGSQHQDEVYDLLLILIWNRIYNDIFKWLSTKSSCLHSGSKQRVLYFTAVNIIHGSWFVIWCRGLCFLPYH